MSREQAFDKLTEKLNSRLLVQGEYGFQKGPLATEDQKNLALIGLRSCDRKFVNKERNMKKPWTD